MYAIVRSGGKQLKVAAGDVVRIEKPAGEKIAKGETLALSGPSVILVSEGDGKGIRTGADALKGVTVQAKVLGTVRTRKVLVFKKKRTKQYRRTRGHRQLFTAIVVEAIHAG